MYTAQKGVAYTFNISLRDTASPTTYRLNPTLATGDFQVSIDNGAFVNLATLPSVLPAGSALVQVNLSAAEMTGDRIAVRAKDAAGAEWDEHIALIETSILLPVILDTQALIESQRGHHTSHGNIFYVDPVRGDTIANGYDGSRRFPLNSVQECHDELVTDSNHDTIILVSGSAVGTTTHLEAVTLTKRYLFIRGPGRDFAWSRTGAGNTIELRAEGIELSGFQLNTAGVGSGNGVDIDGADFAFINNLWINDTRGDAINVNDSAKCIITHNVLEGSGLSGSGHGINVNPAGGASDHTFILDNHIDGVQGHGIWVRGGSVDNTTIQDNDIHNCTGWGLLISADVTNCFISHNRLGNNDSGDISDSGTDTVKINNEEWSTPVTGAAVVWDSLLTGASFNIPTSAGRRLRTLSSSVITIGEVVSATVNTVTLNGDAASEDGAYDPAIISIIAGEGFGQSRGILEYEGATKTAVIDRSWKMIPDVTSKYVITAWEGREHVNEGLARGGTTNTVTLNALASDYDDVYVRQLIFIRSGTGEDQIGHIIAYNGTTKVATVDHNWAIVPDNTSAYTMLPSHAVTVDEIAVAVWGYVVEGSLTALNFIRLIGSVLFGKATATQNPRRVIYRDTEDTKDRVDVLHSSDGDRTDSTLDGD